MTTAAPAPPPIDPTKNVLETIDQERSYQNDMRAMESKLQDAKRDGAISRLTQRMEDDRYSGREIAAMLAKSVADTSALLSKSVEQTQIGLNVRVTDLERARYQESGKSSGISTSWGVLVAVLMAGLTVGGLVLSVIGRLAG